MAAMSFPVALISDDLHFITVARDTTLREILNPVDDVFSYDRSLYRPLTQDLYFRILYPFFGLSGTPYHLVNLALMAGICLLVISLAWRMFGARKAGLWATLFYLLAPLNRMLFTRVCYIQDILMTFLALLAVSAFVSSGQPSRRPVSWSILGAVFYLLSLLAKESALLLPAMLWALDFFTGRRDERIPAFIRRRFSIHAPFDLTLLFYLGFRFAFITPGRDGAYGMAAGANVAERLTEYLGYIAATVLPFFPARSSLSLPGVAVVTVILVGMLAWKRPKPTVMVKAGLAWFVIGLLIFLPLKNKGGDYFISFASIGFFWAVGAVVANYCRSAGRMIIPAVFALLLCVANLRVNYLEFVEHDLTISRETQALQQGLQTLRPELPTNAKVVLLLNYTADVRPNSFGVSLIYQRPDIVAIAPDEAFAISQDQPNHYHPRPDFDFSNTYIFGFSSYGFCEFELRDGRLAVRKCT